MTMVAMVALWKTAPAVYVRPTQAKKTFPQINKVMTMKDSIRARIICRLRRGLDSLTMKLSRVKLDQMEISPFIHPVYEGQHRKISGVELTMRLFDGKHYHCAKRHIDDIEHQKGADIINDMSVTFLQKSEELLTGLSKNAPENFFFSFNFAAEQLYCAQVFGAIIALREKISSQCRVVIEIKESSLPEYDDDLVDVFERLRSRGIELSLTDFGKYSSSLLYLEHAGFSSLKIDRTVALTYKGTLVNKNLVKSIVSATQDLGMVVEAEGVESEEQCQLLVDCGITQMQGPFFAKPIPLKEFKVNDYCF